MVDELANDCGVWCLFKDFVRQNSLRSYGGRLAAEQERSVIWEP